jgi:parvulin-like peptidyl-prolyl isomerase
MLNNPPPTRRVRSAHESKSATVRAAAAAPSRRQQSKWQREQHQQYLLYVGIAGLAVVIVAIFAGGLIYDNIIRANEVVAQIGSDNITASQLVDEMKPAVRALDAQAKQLGGSGNSNIAQYIDQQKRNLPDQTLNQLIDDHVIAQEAARRGISVSPAELDDKERQTVADFQNASNPAPTTVPTASASDTSAATDATPAPDATPATGATPAAAAATPTAVPTLDTSAYGPALAKMLDGNSLTEQELRTRLEQSMLRDKLQTAIGTEQVPPVQDQVHARHILVATPEQAQDVLTQLQGGADFATLAGQVSIDPGTKDKGGDLGWFGRGVMDKPFEDAAFALQAGQLSDVVHGANGYHIIQVLERDANHPLTPDQLTSQRQTAFSTWLNSQQTGPDVKLQLSQPDRDWVLSRIGIRP